MEKKNVISPYILKESKEHLTQLDIYSELMKNRILFFDQEFNDETCSVAISQLIYLASVSDSPITIYDMSGGGACYVGLALYDTIQLLKKKGVIVKVIACGIAASMGSILLSAATPGYRMALKHTRVMIHQVSTGTGRSTNADIQVLAKETDRLNDELMGILSEVSGKSLDEVKLDCNRDCWLTAEECLPGAYGPKGLIDSIVEDLA